MNLQKIFAKLQREEITFIGDEVAVQFDNGQQSPLGFQWQGRHYEVLQLLHVTKNNDGCLNYIIITDGGAFCLTLQRSEMESAFSKSKWKLNYRVKDDDELAQKRVINKSSIKKSSTLLHGMSRFTMVPLLLANVVHYHGHLCPELAIGYRAALFAQQELGLSREKAHHYFVIAENMSSSIEALQLMTGCTIGNQNFFAYDLGKHVYYFGKFDDAYKPGKALRLALTSLVFDISHKGVLEEKVTAGEADVDERIEYEQAIDAAVQKVLDLPEQSLFSHSWISLEPPQPTIRRDYIRCSRCGEVVAVEKAIPEKKGMSCRGCSAKAI